MGLGFMMAAGWHLFQEAGLPSGFSLQDPPTLTIFPSFFFSFPSPFIASLMNSKSELLNLSNFLTLTFSITLASCQCMFYASNTFESVFFFFNLIPLFYYSLAQHLVHSCLRNVVDCLHSGGSTSSHSCPHLMTLQLYSWRIAACFPTCRVWAGLMICFSLKNVAEVTFWELWSFSSPLLGLLLWVGDLPSHMEKNPAACQPHMYKGPP